LWTRWWHEASRSAYVRTRPTSPRRDCRRLCLAWTVRVEAASVPVAGRCGQPAPHPPAVLPEDRMSVTEQDLLGPGEPFERWGDGPAAYAPGEAPRGPNDRTPPQDNAAEQSVLGSMLLSKDAIADVSEVLRGMDFYRPAHELIHDAVIDLYGRSEPADPVTVAAELQRRGELAKVGGAPYLHTLAANVPIAANAGYHAEDRKSVV